MHVLRTLTLAAFASCALIGFAEAQRGPGPRGRRGPGPRAGGGPGGSGGSGGPGARPRPPAPPSPADIVRRLDTDGDGKISAAEAQAAGRHGRRIMGADADGDGFVTQAELQAHRQQARQGRRGRRGRKARRRNRRGQRANRANRAFRRLDTDGDGKISAAEAQAAGATAAQRIMAADADGDGFVTEQELKDYAFRQGTNRAFNKLDKNNDGFLDSTELGRRASRLQGADTDGDGKISSQEFFDHANAQRQKAQARAQTARTFRSSDANNDRKLSASEWPANATATHAAVDADGDGQVTPQEIAAYAQANNGATPF